MVMLYIKIYNELLNEVYLIKLVLKDSNVVLLVSNNWNIWYIEGFKNVDVIK